MMDKVREAALKHALKNAWDYGKAVPSGVVGKVLAEVPECKKQMKEAMKEISHVVDQVNRMSRDQVKDLLNNYEFEEKQEKSDLDKIKDKVPNAIAGKVMTRLPPEPNAAALHIGHAKAMWLDRTVADVFNGKCILRWDDTNPEKEKGYYINEIKKDIDWMGIAYDSEVFASDFMAVFYELCEKLLKEGNGYVCTCSDDQIKQGRDKKLCCSCSRRDMNENMMLWKSMLSGDIEPGKAIVRMKGDMKSHNSAMRDPSLFRIVNAEHFRQGSKYRVWPLYDFESAVMDSPSTLGITHPLRSKEYELRDEPYYKLIEYLELEKPVMITIARLAIPGYPVSKRLIKPLVESGQVWGWDDPRLVTIKGLARRGIQSQAVKDFVLQFGISTSESSPDLEKLFALNKKIIDPVSQRRMFVKNPVGLLIENLTSQKVILNNHPENDLGKREIFVQGSVYVSQEDLHGLEPGETLRLKDFCNVSYEKSHFTFMGNESMKDAKKIQWVPADGAKCKVFVPEKLFDENDKVDPKSMAVDEGLCEPSCLGLRVGDMVQFERYGFVRIDKIDKESKAVEAIFCHK